MYTGSLVIRYRLLYMDLLDIGYYMDSLDMNLIDMGLLDPFIIWIY